MIHINQLFVPIVSNTSVRNNLTILLVKKCTYSIFTQKSAKRIASRLWTWHCQLGNDRCEDETLWQSRNHGSTLPVWNRKKYLHTHDRRQLDHGYVRTCIKKTGMSTWLLPGMCPVLIMSYHLAWCERWLNATSTMDLLGWANDCGKLARDWQLAVHWVYF